MTARQTRMAFVVVLVAGIALAAFLALRALGENMLYFYSPSQLASGEAPIDQRVRVGGLVVNGSIQRATEGLEVRFDLTDNARSVTVKFGGILPDLFREGQGIVAMGQLDKGGVFVADEVLAKHDENYMPPEAAAAMKMAASGGQMPASHTQSGSSQQDPSKAVK